MDICKDIQKKSGKGSIFTTGSDSTLSIPRWSTSIDNLDSILGGGMPQGRIVEIFGPESSGKTSLVYWLMSLHKLGVYLPIEGCVDCDTEFFNGERWKKISEYEEGERVLQYNEDGTATLEFPLKYHKKSAKFLWHVHSKARIDMVISEHHNVVYKSKYKDKLTIKPFHDIRMAIDENKEGFCGNIPKVFCYSGNGIDLSEEKIRLMVAVFADGSFRHESSTLCTVGISKERKKKRLEGLLNKCGIEYRIREEEYRGISAYIFNAPFNAKHYPKEWYNMTIDQFKIVLDEMQYWDGTQYEVGHMPSFSTSNKEDADFIQFAYTSVGYPAYITDRGFRRGEIKGRKFKDVKRAYCVCSGKKSKIASMRKAKYELYKTKDDCMYCFTMKSKMWVMRRNDKILVTGNTFDAERAKALGVQDKQMIVYRAQYGEQALDAIIKFAKAGVPVIALDSVPACQPKDDVERIEKSSENELRMGGTARLFSKTLPSIERIVEETGTTLILVNQVRDNTQAMSMFADKDITPGGRAIKFYSSIRIKVARRSWIEIPNKNPMVSAANEKVGLLMKAKVVKSKVSNPYGECEMPFFFDRGFVSYDDIKQVRQELLKERKKLYGV